MLTVADRGEAGRSRKRKMMNSETGEKWKDERQFNVTGEYSI
jgi:hypothetical protein